MRDEGGNSEALVDSCKGKGNGKGNDNGNDCGKDVESASGTGAGIAGKVPALWAVAPIGDRPLVGPKEPLRIVTAEDGDAGVGCGAKCARDMEDPRDAWRPLAWIPPAKGFTSG